MTYNELNEVLLAVAQASSNLEEIYVENEGEITEETELMEAQVEGLRTLLENDGIDMLGAWLKSKEDRIKARKAEIAYIKRGIEADEKSLEFIKSKSNEVMSVLGVDKVKGSRGYSFTATVSTKTEVDKEVLKAAYGERIEQILRANDIPAYVGVSLTASSTKAAEVGLEDGDDQLFVTTTKPTVRFTKPRAAKEA